MQIMKRVQGRTNKSVKWVPMAWCVNLLNQLKRRKFIDDKGHEKLLNEVRGVESANYKLRCLVWVNFPMIYTQVVLYVYLTLVICLMIGSQYITPLSEDQCSDIINGNFNGTILKEDESYTKDRFKHNASVFFHFAQYLFYLGWITVAKIMLNPFGEDPEDFDTGYIVDRNLQTSLQIVDGNSEDFPSLTDPFNNMIPKDLPPTPSTITYKYAERGPLTVEELLGDKKMNAEKGVLQSVSENLRKRKGVENGGMDIEMPKQIEEE